MTSEHGLNRLRGLRVRRLELLRSRLDGNPYGVTFLDAEGEVRPLSIIAGPMSTGKSTTAEFIKYAVGGEDYPQTQEVLANVRLARLEIALNGVTQIVERSAHGAASLSASVLLPEEGEGQAGRLTRTIEPTSAPDSLSQHLLSACNLDGIALRTSDNVDSDVQVLSVRDVWKLVWLPNDRLDSKNLLFEGNPVVAAKFRQTVDAVFGVDDSQGSALLARQRELRRQLREAQAVARSMRTVVSREYSGGPLELERERDNSTQVIERLTRQLSALDQQQINADAQLRELRDNLARTESQVAKTRIRLRNQRRLLNKLSSLRGQYVDDERKLAFLADAERLFNPLDVSRCPACLSTVDPSPIPPNNCGLCHRDLGAEDEHAIDGRDTMEAELRAVRRRIVGVTRYMSEIESMVRRLADQLETEEREAARSAEAVNRIAALPAPFLASRDAWQKDISAAEISRNRADSGLNLWKTVSEADDSAQRLAVEVERVKELRRSANVRPDRDAVIHLLSSRFASVLADFGYPKLEDAFIDSQLRPCVRGASYKQASSGGQVLIALAWYLAIFEVSYERAENALGILLIDSPQKNLGQGAQPGDEEFADGRLVSRFYDHVIGWLSGPGRGAQVIVIDNTPPESVQEHIVVRYTRNAKNPPYGLIYDAV